MFFVGPPNLSPTIVAAFADRWDIVVLVYVWLCSGLQCVLSCAFVDFVSVGSSSTDLSRQIPACSEAGFFLLETINHEKLCGYASPSGTLRVLRLVSTR